MADTGGFMTVAEVGQLADTSTGTGQFMSVAEASQLTHLADSTLRAYMRDGRLPKYTVGDRRVVVKRSDVYALIAGGK